jgi:hypothetical protein
LTLATCAGIGQLLIVGAGTVGVGAGIVGVATGVVGVGAGTVGVGNTEQVAVACPSGPIPHELIALTIHLYVLFAWLVNEILVVELGTSPSDITAPEPTSIIL